MIVADKCIRILALRDYEGRVTKYADGLVSQLATFSGKPVNATLWLNFYSFDIMGDLGFGKSFDMLKNGEKVWIECLSMIEAFSDTS